MAVQKTFGGRRSTARRQRFLIWVIFGVICLVLFQFWTYEQTGSTYHSNIHGSKMALGAMLMKSWFAPEDDDGVDHNRDFVVLREIITVCNSSASNAGSEEERSKTLSGECLTKLQENCPSLQASVMPALGGQQESCKNGIDEESVGALRKEVDTLSDSLRKSTVFLEMKDTRESGLTDKDTTWFMSSIHGSNANTGIPEEFEFPSELSNGRLLCMMGNNQSDGTQNKYGFARKGYLPPGATLLPGLTLVAENYWDYNNIWHAMSALVAFVSWGTRNGCAVPQRLLLYHWGEHVPSMGSWIESVLQASFGRKLEVEGLEQQRGSEGPLVCLERAVVNRRGLGSMSVENMNSMFDNIRCRSRKYCGVVMPEATDLHTTHVTLLLRSGARAFRNASDVWRVIDEVCEKVGNCHLEVAYASNLSFCEQVGIMSRTDVLVTTHGAQMTNMMFMSKGGSVMELIPKGWFEFAGIGQYIYSWLSSWANLHYEGVWRDPEGPDCPYPTSETLKCLLFHKDLEVGHNETQLAVWTRDVLRNFSQRRESTTLVPSKSLHCSCDEEDNSI